MVKKNGEGEILRCSFCNKDQNDVRKLIAGPTVFICDECVEVCNDIIVDDERFELRKCGAEPPASLFQQQLLDHADMAALMERVAELSSSDQWFLVLHLLARLRALDVASASTTAT